jgi:uncharacterized protein (TIGR00251 family)
VRDGVRVAIRVSPGRKVDRLVALARVPEGGRVLKVAVSAPPEGGRANEALLSLLARAFDLPRRDLRLLSGGASRGKRVLIAGDPSALLPRLSTLVAALPEE